MLNVSYKLSHKYVTPYSCTSDDLHLTLLRPGVILVYTYRWPVFVVVVFSAPRQLCSVDMHHVVIQDLHILVSKR